MILLPVGAVHIWSSLSLGPCKVIGPVFEALAPQYPNIVFRKLDVDACQQVAASQGIQAMPTFKVYHKGKQVKEMKGAGINADSKSR